MEIFYICSIWNVQNQESLSLLNKENVKSDVPEMAIWEKGWQDHGIDRL